MKKLIILVLFLLISLLSFSQRIQERYFENLFADDIKGETEVTLSDRSRVDIITDTFAIEVDFAKKWAESIGQSLFYSYALNKKPGILLITT